MSGDTGIRQMKLTHDAMMEVVYEGLKIHHFAYDKNTPTPIDVTRNNDGEFIVRFIADGEER